jgi:hypothetical protein
MALRSYLHSTFDPRRIPGLQAWYDAADSSSITLDAGRVSQWSDKSGNARHATNTTSGSTQPSYTVGARNGLNVLTFAAASVQRLTVPSSTAAFNYLHNGTPSYFAAVSRFGTTANPNAAYMLCGNSGGASANTGFVCLYDDRSSASRNNASNVGISRGVLGQFAVVSLVNDIIVPQEFVVQEHLLSAANATASQRSLVSIDGATYQGANTLTSAPSAGNATYSMQLGAAGDNALPLQGDICELMFFSQLPTAAARDMIRRYLGAKWGVTVA